MGGTALDLKDFIQFTFLGLASAGIYSMLSQGIVLIYRGSGTVNFAHGAMAMLGGYIYWDLRWDEKGNDRWGFVPAFLVAVIAVALLAALVHLFIMRPLAKQSALVRIIASLGLLTVITGAGKLYWGGDNIPVKSPWPSKRWLWHSPWGKINVTPNGVWLTLIALVITVVLWAIYRYTKFGLAVVAAAEDERAASALGWSPDMLATVNWAAGGALAGVAGVFMAPITNLQMDTGTVLLVVALAAALLAGFSSFWLSFAGAMGIGILRSVIAVTPWVKTQAGAADAVPFIIIIAVLVLRGRALPLRSHVLERMPKLGYARLPAWLLVVPAVLAALSIWVFNTNWNTAFFTSYVMAILLLSVVVLTGFAGQVSLAQFALAGLGALVAGRMIFDHDLPFEVAMPIGVIAAMLIGLLFALPALRTRGINLAVATLGLGLAVQSVIFNNPKRNGGGNGVYVGPQKLFGIEIGRVDHPAAYAVFVLFCLVLAIVVVLNIRRGRAGRRLIAIRTNERAAASLGVSVFGAKLYAFAVSAAIAGLAGILYAFKDNTLIFGDNFNPFTSINAITLAVLGGIGYVLGPVMGSTLAIGGVGALITTKFHWDQNWIVLVGGVILLGQLLAVPDGMASHPTQLIEKLDRRAAKKLRAETAARAEVAPVRVDPAELAVSDLSVRVGGIYAVFEAGLQVGTGEVVGLIGPNGAGKTTFIDAVTGFVRPAKGRITFNGADVTRWPAARRKRAGISRTFQSLELFEDLSVRDNLLAGADDLGWKPYLTDLFWPRKEHLPPAALRAISDLDLHDVLELPASDLPYGQRRLVSIARALAGTPSILLLDEPAAGLSDAETAELRHLIRRLADEWGVGVLLVEHDMSLVMAVCDRIVALETGQVIAEGRPDEIARNERVRAAYLGDEVADGIAEVGAGPSSEGGAHSQ